MNQIKAQNITNYKFPQLGMLFISLYYIYLKLINYNIDNTTRWSSTYNMINNYIPLYNPINTTIHLSNNKAFKDKSLKITKDELSYLKTTLLVLKVFVKATNKLQADLYPTIYYTIPLIYNIYNQLEKLKEEFKVSYF